MTFHDSDVAMPENQQPHDSSMIPAKNGAELEPVPRLLAALDRLLSDADELEALAAAEQARATTDRPDWQRQAAKRIIRRYSNRAAMVGGATGMVAAAPGMGTLLATVGGASADTALSMKWQVEMVMALAALRGHDLHDPGTRERCVMLAGLGLAAGTGKRGKLGQMSQQAFVDFAQQRLQTFSAAALRQLFRQLGTTAGRRSLEKLAPFGVGVVWGSSFNKLTAVLVGERAWAYLEAQQRGEVSWEGAAEAPDGSRSD